MSSSEAVAPAPAPGLVHIILFYMYTPVSSPSTTLEWQRRLCARLSLLGRIRVASEGINGTLAGSEDNIQAYIAEMNNRANPEHEGIFVGIEYKFSTAAANPFPELGMFEVKEITASGTMAKSVRMLLQQGKPKLTGPGKAEGDDGAAEAQSAVQSDLHLSPEEWHEALKNFDPETDLLLDTRNAYETAIGMFDHAVDPKIRSFHQLPEYVTQNLPAIKSKKRILMYCTGGIRCEKASLYMKHRTGAQVQQLRGGIHKYLDAYPDGGFFKGKNFVFDGRLAMASTDPTVVGHCVHCAVTCDRQSEQVVCRVCKSFVILCEGCTSKYEEEGWRVYCSEHILLAAGKDYDPAQAPAQAEPAEAVASPSSSSVAPASSSPAAAAADAPASDSLDAAPSDSASPADSWSPPSSDPGCPAQLHSFLARFTRAQLQTQLDEINAILRYFKAEKRKAGSRSRNRKANLYLQKKRLEEYLATRPLEEGEQAPQADSEAAGEAGTAQSEEKEASASTAQPPLLPFVPLLNV